MLLITGRYLIIDIMGTRHKARQNAVKILFQIEQTKEDPKLVAIRYIENNPMDEDERVYCLQIVYGYLQHSEEIDELIDQTAEKWRFSRISNMEKSILRCSLYELLYTIDIPPEVAIDEGVNLAREMGTTDKSYAFVNGILDKIYKDRKDELESIKV